MNKIKAGTLYKGNDSDLLYLKESTARLLHSINTSSPDERVKIHTDLFPRLFKRLGKNTWFETPFNCDYGQYIEIGENCYFNHHCSIGDGGKVVIGNNVIIGPYVGIYTAEHPLDATLRCEGWQSVQDITIGNNVWIGANVTILSGVSIGDNAVIGAGSVVTKNISANTLAYGVPCREIRKL